MSDANEMTMDQINRNFVATNEWMKQERKERDILEDKYDKLATSFAKQDTEIQSLRSQIGQLTALVFGNGPTEGY